MKQQIILFDIDYTLFDTTKYKNSVAKAIASIITAITPEDTYQAIDQSYKDIRQFGSFDPHAFAKHFVAKFPNSISEKLMEEIWYQENLFKEAVYSEVIPTLTELVKKNYLLGIFSSGNSEFQKAKISHLQDFFAKDHLHITPFKEKTLPKLIQTYRDEKIILVDDYLDILRNAKQLKRDLTAIWMKRGKFAEKAENFDKFVPDATIFTLDELVTLVDTV